jgi:hypothetical protein
MHAHLGKSWMRPSASKIRKLLYISDVATGDVFVYDYRSGELVGTLAGFSRPGAQCIDVKGDIWITDRSAHEVVEYRHGGVTPIKRMQTGGDAGGCWIDPTTGNLAVANQETSSGGGDIRVFTRSGPKKYSNPDCYYLETPAYDAAGNLYVEAYSASYVVYVCELPHLGNALRTISVNQKIYGPGDVVWDGKYLDVSDEFYDGGKTTALYQTEEGSSGALIVVGTTVLTDGCDSGNSWVWQPFIVGTRNPPINTQQGHKLVALNAYCPGGQWFSAWAYPSGGNPIKTPNNQPQEPEGESVSISAP